MLTATKENEVVSLRPAVFFDRDGTLIDEVGYLSDPGNISFFPGIPEALRELQMRGYLLVVVTNQSGVGRGLFDEETALAVNLAFERLLNQEGVCLSAVYYCPHAPGAGCQCRKPETLMVRRALEDLPVDGTSSWMVGDVDKDVLAGRSAGLRAILVETGKHDKGNPPQDLKRCPSVVEAVDFILEEAPE